MSDCNCDETIDAYYDQISNLEKQVSKLEFELSDKKDELETIERDLTKDIDKKEEQISDLEYDLK